MQPRSWGMPARPDDPQTLPAPSAALVLFRVHVEATIATMGRRKAEKYLSIMSETLAWEESLSSVFQIRPADQHAEVRAARLQAAAIFKAYSPLWLARIPRE